MSLGSALAKMLQAQTDEERKKAGEEFTEGQRAFGKKMEALGATVTFSTSGSDMAKSLKKKSPK